MTRSVLTGPPWRRGLVWAGVLLLGVAGLVGTRDGSDVAAKDEAAKTTLPADLALVPRESFGFASVRVADLWNDEGTKALRAQLAKEFPGQFKELQKSVAVPPEQIERLTVVMPKTPAPRDQGVVVLILVTTNKPYDKKKVLDELVPDGKEEKHKGKTYHALADAAVYPVDDKTFLMGRTEAVREAIEQAGTNGDSPLAPALAVAAGKHHVTGAMRPAALLQSLNAEGQGVPPQLDTVKPLLEAPAAYGTIDFGKEAKAEAHVLCAGEAEAKDVVTATKGLVALIQYALPEAEKALEKMPAGEVDTFKKLFKEFGTALKTVPIEAKGKEVTTKLALKADLPTLSKGVLEGLTVVQGQAKRLNSANNLKQMALAMHNYADTYGNFPAAAIYKDGKPLLSWRVAILPYIEQDNLYKQFRLDEPWDSEHNKKLLEDMPRTYIVPGQEKAKEKVTKTHYRVFHGKGAAFEGEKGTTFESFTDGTSNTILIVEAAEAVPWTKPEELPFDPKKDPPKLGLKGVDNFNAAFADGSVRTLAKDIDKDKLKALITRNGGETIGD
jgi:hypothetical protein